ncbi:Snurportin-1 [Babesia duncani]|uniref:Snurportin-1 n=1 Tax=Babesia duncani TaxID=323732 RepID=A0AAD9UQ69_9APIC|nr:Snurportin-1 [Babesia duncani]
MDSNLESSSYSRLEERCEATRRINLVKLNRTNRIESLQQLRRRTARDLLHVRSKRHEQLASVEKEPMVLMDESKSEDNNVFLDKDIEERLLHVNNVLCFSALGTRTKPPFLISDILTWPEFLLGDCVDIAQEAEALLHTFLFIRPEGRRVMIVIKDYTAMEYSKNNTCTRTFKVCFSKGPTILDCVSVEQEDEQFFYIVLDVLIFNGCMLAHSDSECRFFFLKSRVEEDDWSVPGMASFSLVNYVECTRENMLEAYYGTCNYQKDSIMFVDKRAKYIGGYNPNWLCWRDHNTSRFPLQCNEHGCLRFRVTADIKSNTLVTLDGTIVGEIPLGMDHTRDFSVDLMIKQVDPTRMQLECGAPPQYSRSQNPPDSMRKIAQAFQNKDANVSSVLFNRLAEAFGKI